MPIGRLLAITAAVAGCQASASASGGASAMAIGEGTGCPDATAAQADVGPPPNVKGNDEHVTLRCGTYHGDLVVSGNDIWVAGAGRGQTIIDGKLVVRGNHVNVSGMTVRGAGDVGGNDNDVSGVDLAGGKRVRGNDNAE